MKTINVKSWYDFPKKFTGIAIYLDGSKCWYVEGKHHRLDGPAIEYADGSKFWYVEGKYHRLDGPAIEWADGSKYWCIEGKYLTFQQFWERMKDTDYAPRIMAYMLGAKCKP